MAGSERRVLCWHHIVPNEQDARGGADGGLDEIALTASRFRSSTRGRSAGLEFNLSFGRRQKNSGLVVTGADHLRTRRAIPDAASIVGDEDGDRLD